MGKIKIEMAELEDTGLIFSMIQELAKWEGYDDGVDASEKLLEESLFGSESISKVLIAYLEEKPVGYMIYCPKISTYTGRNEIYLQDLYLRREARGRGLGLALMAKLAEIALDSKATRIEWLVEENNNLALSFYKKLGADVIDTLKVARLDKEELAALARRAKY